jgi:hypothetical protein
VVQPNASIAVEPESGNTKKVQKERETSMGTAQNSTKPYATGQEQPQPSLNIYFVAKNLQGQWPDIAELGTMDIDRQAHRFRGGVNNWVVQSYLQLREPLARAGIRARITDCFVTNAICIAHRDHLNCFLDFCERAYIVAVRADRPPVQVGRRQIVQNVLDGRSTGERYLPFWPQPGLIPRDPCHGSRIEHMAYFGRDASMPQWLSDPRFMETLKRIGVTFSLRTKEWHDYSDVDLVLAHRIASPTILHEKPASKLINAWHAGVPALLSNEPAFAALRRSDLDYLTIDTPQSLLRRIEYLRSDTSVYHAMMENGRLRAREYSAEAVRARWLELILADVVPDFLRSRTAMPPLLRFPPFVARMVRQKLTAKAFRRKTAFELRLLQNADHPRDGQEFGHRDIEAPLSVPYGQVKA